MFRSNRNTTLLVLNMLFLLKEADLDTELNKRAILEHPQIESLVDACSTLLLSNMFNQYNFTRVCFNAHTRSLACIFSDLQGANSLNQETFLVALDSDNTVCLASAVTYLVKAGILNYENYIEVSRHKNGWRFASVLCLLAQANLLTPDNKNRVCECPYTLGLELALYSLHSTGLLNQVNLDKIIDPRHKLLLGFTGRHLVWERIPDHFLAEAVLEKLFIAARQSDFMQQFERIIDQTIQRRDLINKPDPRWSKIIQDKVLKYLRNLTSPENAKEYKEIKTILDTIQKTKNLRPIWSAIEQEIKDELWMTLGVVGDDENFKNGLNYAIYIPADEWGALNTMLITSAGYQAYLAEQLAASLDEQKWFLSRERHGFWSNRHASSKAQENFDRQYGLISLLCHK